MTSYGCAQPREDGTLGSIWLSKCVTCQEWLSLGPANDTDEVRVEIRASQLAGDPQALSWRTYFSGAEWLGYKRSEATDIIVVDRDGRRRVDPFVPLNLDSPNWRAGWLAREIVSHDAEHAAHQSATGEEWP